MARITDDELVSICTQEIDAASGYAGGELSEERAAGMDYYLGEPYGNEVEGRSQVVTREVLDTIESIMPQLMRIYADAENLVEFDAVGEEDEEAAQQESDRVNHAFWKDNRGFFNLYAFCKDALLSKTGNLKCWWDDASEPEREEYRGLDDVELGELMADGSVDREIIEYEQAADGHHVIFLTTHKRGQVRIEPVTPEEFGVNRDARSPFVEDANFVYHRTRKTYSELVADGYDRKTLDGIPSDDDADTEERLARRHLTDESDLQRYASHKRLRTFWITECYLRVDRDDDGVSELLKVTLAAGSTSTGAGRLLDVEEVDRIPFFAAAPVLLTHKFYGLSIADLVLDLQHIKSTLTRQILDNTYLANNLRTHVNKNVNLDDLLTRRPGGVVRHKGDTIPGQNMSPEPFAPLAPHTFDLLGYLDALRKDRTGSGDDVPGLDAKTLANVNSSVAAIAYDQARARIELIARILAEVALRPLMVRIHELLQKNQDKAEMVKLRGQWVHVNPSEWRTRKNVTVMVGLGIASRERRLVALDSVIARQESIVQGGGFGTLLLPDHIYNAVHDHAEALGLDAGRYFQDPRELPPKPPEGPSVEQQALMAQAQAQLGAARAQMERNQVEMAKVASAERIRVAELQNTQSELAQRRQIESLKADRAELAQQREAAEKSVKASLDAEIKARDQEIKIAETRLRDQQEQAKREADILKAVIQSGTQLTAEQMKLVGASEGGASGHFEAMQQATSAMVQESIGALSEALARELGEVKAKLIEQSEKSSAPKLVRRDENGLIVAIGDVPVQRDDSGRVTQIG